MLGRYALYEEIASGGMASVHFGRLLGPAGFARTVAIKQLHPKYAKDPDFVKGLLDEARLSARVRHPNVVPTLDVVAQDGELFVVMEYVEGESLSRLMRRAHEKGERLPHPVVVTILSGVLHGLHAAHEARGELGEPLNIVHRDVSPQNVLVGVDGVPRVLDFGIAKAAGRLQTTRDGRIKGKLAYMPPEQVQGAVTRRTDVFAAAVVLWECLVGDRLFADEDPAQTLHQVLHAEVLPPSVLVPGSEPFDPVVLKGLHRDPRERFATAKEMALALETCATPATTREVGEWVASIAHESIDKRSKAIAEIESGSGSHRRLRDIVKTEPADPTDVDARPPVHVESIAPAKPRRAGPVVALALALVAATIAIIAIVLARTHRDAPPPVSTSTSTTTSASATSATASVSAPPPAVSSPPSPLLLPSSPPPPPPLAPTSKKKPNCDPPFVYDGNGKRQYKPECL